MKVLFTTFAYHLQNIDKLNSRLEITAELARLFTICNAEEIDKAVYLSLGILAPKFANLEFNLAEKLMMRVIAVVTNRTISDIDKYFKQTGDLGLTIFQLLIKNNQYKIANHTSSLSLIECYQKLVSISKDSGMGSQDRKIMAMANLLRQVDALSAKYLVRIPIKKLRLGFSDMTIIDALSWMQTGDKSLRKDIEKAFNIKADIGKIAQIFKQGGVTAINNVISEPGIPIRPAKATPLTESEDILTKMNQKSLLEPKYDGFRVQIHMTKKSVNSNSSIQKVSLFDQTNQDNIKSTVTIFSRNLDNITYMFPELVRAISILDVESIIVDAEAVATDPDTGQMLDFQETIKRKRKHNINQVASQIPLTAFIFDILYLNGESLIQKPLLKRRRYLEEVFTIKNKSLEVAPYKIVDNIADFNKFFNQMANEKLEGLMAKKLDAPYRAGARDFTWVKYKLGMQSELADTVDAVVMGYFKGQGKWTQWGLGKILIGIPDGDNLIALSKVGSGFSEDTIKELVARLDKIRLDSPPENYQFDKNLIPDVWVEPRLVIEIRADSISKSSFYQTGLSLRFPRFVRFRDDKDVTDATSLNQLKMF